MWFVPALLAQSVGLPPETPIPCLVCNAESAAVQTFLGTVKTVTPGRIVVFNGKSHQSMGFAVPADFRGVESSDGKIKDAPLARVPPGLLARITYRTVGERRTATQVLLLTINQCRALMAAERLNNAPSGCPD
jgi:hypothetical protein